MERMTTVTIDTVYKELMFLKKEIEIVKYALIPEEQLSAGELKEIRQAKKEMESGKEKSFKDIFS